MFFFFFKWIQLKLAPERWKIHNGWHSNKNHKESKEKGKKNNATVPEMTEKKGIKEKNLKKAIINRINIFKDMKKNNNLLRREM